MKVRRLLGLVATVVVSCIGLPSATAAAEPPRIANLRVEGDEASWHAESRFRLEWDQVPGPPAYARAALYRTYDSEGNLVEGPIRVVGTPGVIDPVEVPPVPGAYTIESSADGHRPGRATVDVADCGVA